MMMVVVMNVSQEKGDDSFPRFGVVFKCLDVPVVVKESDDDLIRYDKTTDHPPCHRCSCKYYVEGQVYEDFRKIMGARDVVK